MITKQFKNAGNVSSITLQESEKNSAIVWKETERVDKNGLATKVLTFVTFPNLNKQTETAVLKSIIKGIVSDETILSELKEKYEFRTDETGKATDEKFEAPALKRLIANFSTDFFLGYVNSSGKIQPLAHIEKQSLKSVLGLSPKKVAEVWALNSEQRRNEIHTLALYASDGLKREGAYLERYKAFSTDKKEPAKAKTEKPAKTEKEPAKA